MTIDKDKLRASAIDWGHHPMEITGDDMQALLDEIDQLKAENESIRSEAKRQEDGLKEMLRRQNKRICALQGKRHD